MTAKKHNPDSIDLAPEVWIVVDSPLVSWALSHVAERVCGRCIRRLRAREAAAAAARRRPRVAVVSAHLLARSRRDRGSAGASSLASRALTIEPFPAETHGRNLSRSGGRGSISLSLSVDEIGRTIRAAWFSGASKGTKPRQRPASLLDLLTRQEQRLFEEIARGSTLQSAAENLAISYKTAESHRTRLYRKLNITNGRQAVLLAIRAGLVFA